MTKAVPKRDICFIKAVLLLCKQGYIFFDSATPDQFDPLPPILLELKDINEMLKLGRYFGDRAIYTCNPGKGSRKNSSYNSDPATKRALKTKQ